MSQMSNEDVVRGVAAFIHTLRHTAGMTRQEVKSALHPKMIDFIWKIEDRRAPTTKDTGGEG